MVLSTIRDWRVDLLSDTKTRPTDAMRAAMSVAVVGDEQQGEDPSVARLNAMVAELLGKPRAVFLPSGTMANLVSILVHCGRGEEILAEASSHLFHFETGGPSGLAGAVVTAIVGRRGMFTASELESTLRLPRQNAPRPRLVWVEQTTNLGGGAIWPLDELEGIRRTADAHGLIVHIDGARLLNAAVAEARPPAVYGEIAESLWIDFSKGLGAPFGAVLAGSDDFIAEATRYKHMLGGAMRQAGIMAAGCIFALENHVTRLADDHAMAHQLSVRLAQSGRLHVVGPVETNIILLDVSPSGCVARELAEGLKSKGIRVGVFGPLLRLVTHLDLPANAIDLTLEAFDDVLKEHRS